MPKPRQGGRADLAVPGAQIALRVRPGGRANRLTREIGQLRARITTPPEDGRAHAAVAALLALGVAKTRRMLVAEVGPHDKRIWVEWAGPDPAKSLRRGYLGTENAAIFCPQISRG